MIRNIFKGGKTSSLEVPEVKFDESWTVAPPRGQLRMTIWSKNNILHVVSNKNGLSEINFYSIMPKSVIKKADLGRQ